MITRAGVHALAVSVSDPRTLPREVQAALRRVGLDAHVVQNGSVLAAWNASLPAVPVDRVDLAKGQVIDPTAVNGSRGSDEFAQHLSSLLAPAGRIERCGETGDVRVGVDVRGIGEMYHARGAGWAIACTNAAVIAEAVDAPIDHEAIAVYATIGHFVAEVSPWQGIRRFGRGELHRMHCGEVDVQFLEPPRARTGSLAESVAAVAEAAPRDVEIELSGGLDSRLILAAARAVGRVPTKGFTIGDEASTDVIVARQLAALAGMRHQIAPVEGFVTQDDGLLRTLTLCCAEDRGWVANPFDSAVLDWAESLRSSAPSFSGQNGETARGFYYRGPHSIAPSGSRLRVLLGWRMGSNDRVSDDVISMDPTAREQVVLRVLAEHISDAGSRHDFLEATDAFYLRHRMTRWVGPAYAASGRRHGVIAPFLSAGWIENARRLAVADRRRSLSVAAAVVQLDPELASVPLAGGVAPRDMANASLRSFGREVSSLAQKSVGKARQRMRRSAGAPNGTQRVAEAFGARVPQILDVLVDEPIIDAHRLHGRTGCEALSGRDLAFLLCLARWRSPRTSAEWIAAVA